ncbi:Hypothetical predicted protein [Marmota monax]|uniref:Uncharacterized protein n=1 Tax=Marmota monax TaxID=9995 RepID=A0A5E4BLN5_MARMO|nr:Hypothetical predicted protein [Marmota monax]
MAVAGSPAVLPARAALRLPSPAPAPPPSYPTQSSAAAGAGGGGGSPVRSVLGPPPACRTGTARAPARSRDRDARPTVPRGALTQRRCREPGWSVLGPMP